MHITGRIAWAGLMTVAACGAAHAGEPDPRDRQAIIAMAGSYTVDFDFRETVAIEPGYALRAPYHATAAVEQIAVVVDEPRRVVLQHILVLEDRVVKHWRQDWVFEDPDLYEFVGHGSWRHRRLSAADVAGTWTQRVYQVDDSPRYQGYGQWTHGENLSAWESNWTWRPLPRRENTQRDDYDVLVGRNRHTLTHTGWVHEQDNYKLVLRDGQQKTLARETGVNRYDHVDLAKADAARGYWSRTQGFWAEVRAAWDAILVPGAAVTLAPSADGAPLWEVMFELADGAEELEPDARRQRVRETLEAHLSLGPLEVSQVATPE